MGSVSCTDPNLTITFVFVVVALIVGGVEAIGLLKDQLNRST
jgi:high-affinity nickel permease